MAEKTLEEYKKENERLRLEIQLLKRPVERITQNTLFKNVAFSDTDVLQTNQKHQITKNVKEWNDLPFTRIYTLNPQNHGIVRNESTHYNVSNHAIHDSLRKLSLAVVGATKNTDLVMKEYMIVRDTYQALKNLFLQKYDERLMQLDRDKSTEVQLNEDS
ncbi:hypothetical protein IGI65_000039 [Enterococcus sp. DIV0755b]|uniref:hypothetical protein n=1 Tax=Enterococcus sp. DIV0755b TaxID=2774657 RepID=UPI003F22FC68